MRVTWKDLTFLPSEEALASLFEAWSWFLPQPFRPVMASTLGDVFFQKEGDPIFWLNTGTAEITQVAGSRAEFLELLKTDMANEWFMPGLIEQLMGAGKTLQPDYCYTFVTLPVFKEGKYDVANLNSVPAKEHFAVTGLIHREIRDLKAGDNVQIKVV